MTHKFPDSEMRTMAVMSGSFNPFTVGHLSILVRGLKMFSHITIMLGQNSTKPQDKLLLHERAQRLASLLSPFGHRVSVTTCSGIVADEAVRLGATAMLRGVRSVTDFEYERNLAEINRTISGIETVLLFSEPGHAAISSSMVRELESYGRDISRFVPSPETIKKAIETLTE